MLSLLSARQARLLLGPRKHSQQTHLPFAFPSFCSHNSILTNAQKLELFGA